MKLTKVTTLIATFAITSSFAQPGQAREHHHRYAALVHAERLHSAHFTAIAGNGVSRAGSFGYRASTHVAARHSGRPAAWCGWQMRQLVDSDPGPAFNLARNWAHWGHGGPPGIGAVVVWSHHVGKIVGQDGGKWIIESGNDGNRLRARPRSLSGVIAIRWS